MQGGRCSGGGECCGSGRCTAISSGSTRRRSPALRLPNGSRNMASTSGVRGEELGKPDRLRLIPSSNEDDCRTIVETTDGKRDAWTEILEVTDGEKDARKVTEDVILLCGEGPPGEGEEDAMGETEVSFDEEEYEGHGYPEDGVYPMHILPNTNHRDGSIYRNIYARKTWKTDFRIADRNETRFEAMTFSDIKDCVFLYGSCQSHSPTPMLQIFSLKLAKIPVDSGSVELYGYIAMRDALDPLLNYVVNFSRDDPIIVEQGSLVEMTGPKRGIELCYITAIEYDMRIKTGEQEQDDLQLIDGVSFIDEINTGSTITFTRRIHGHCGAVDITVSTLDHAVEATVEVVISEVRSSFNLCLSCFVSGLGEEIRLFDGAIGEPRGLRRSVVAVVIDTWMDLKFKVGSRPSYSSDTEHCCSFKAFNHGCTSQQIEVDFASISVKVTWSTLSFSVVN
ncbi:uncharacterized protein LOC133891391 isoform X2 [Phragmites australis]|uniref:uncharacterized protein LOC133891391 isoform X2 n=1 Tax=Phragmites australis TaxID=29695 RepID=UPI002D76E112|nr:uncharacterized protein LOC133891391 isoform X2 [Phragmites australis]